MKIVKSNSDFIPARSHYRLTPGEALKNLRELQDLSQADLENLTGISQSNLSALENNARQIGRERAIVLAKALKVHPAVILFPDFEMDIAA